MIDIRALIISPDQETQGIMKSSIDSVLGSIFKENGVYTVFAYSIGESRLSDEREVFVAFDYSLRPKEERGIPYSDLTLREQENVKRLNSLLIASKHVCRDNEIPWAEYAASHGAFEDNLRELRSGILERIAYLTKKDSSRGIAEEPVEEDIKESSGPKDRDEAFLYQEVADDSGLDSEVLDEIVEEAKRKRSDSAGPGIEIIEWGV